MPPNRAGARVAARGKSGKNPPLCSVRRLRRRL